MEKPMMLLEIRAATRKAEERVLMVLAHLRIRTEAVGATDEDRMELADAEAVICRARLSALHLPKADLDAWLEARQRTLSDLITETECEVAREGAEGLQHGLARLDRMQEEDDRWIAGHALNAWTTAGREIDTIRKSGCLAA